MSSKIFKNHQVNVGIPFQVKIPLNFQTIKTLGELEDNEEYESSKSNNHVVQRDNGSEEVLLKAKMEAEMIIKEAQYEALRIVESAENEANEFKVSVEEEARLNGYNDGYENAKAQCESLIGEAETIKMQAKAKYSEVLAGIETDAVNLILDIAKNVLAVEISFNKEDIFYLIRQALEKCTNKENIILKISPQDYEYANQNKDRLLSMLEGVGDLEIKCDSSLKEGACIVETAFGTIDASVQTKLKKIEEAFKQLIIDN